MKSIALISLNSGGTMGHGRLIASIANKFRDLGNKVHIISNVDYTKYFQINQDVNNWVVKSDDHTNWTIGGMFDFKYRKEILDIVVRSNIEASLFSTFFDFELLKELKRISVKTILISYPLRDTYRKALKQRIHLAYFDKLISLYDPSVKIFNSSRREVVNPLCILNNKNGLSDVYDILICCGGGGRPSSTLFIKKNLKALKCILPHHKNLRALIIKGQSIVDKSINGIKVIDWSHHIGSLISSARLIISEVGYFSMLDLIQYQRPAILVPGSRIIDNQELRALSLENHGIGKVYFPFESEERLIDLYEQCLSKLVFHKDKFSILNKKFYKHKDMFEVLIRELQ